jgi:hypothetical protein
MMINGTSLVLKDPIGTIKLLFLLNMSSRNLFCIFLGKFIEYTPLNVSAMLTTVDIAIPLVSSPNSVGIWQILLVKSQLNITLASTNFLLILEHDKQWLNIDYFSLLTRFWSITDRCSTDSLSLSQCVHPNNDTMPIMSSCFERQWSFFFSDMKSDW